MPFDLQAQLPCIHPDEKWDEQILAYRTAEILTNLATRALESGITAIPSIEIIASVTNANIHKRATEIMAQLKNLDTGAHRGLPASTFVTSLYLGKSLHEGSQDEYPLSDTYPSREVHALGRIGAQKVIDTELLELYRDVFISCNPDFVPAQGPRQLQLKVRRIVVDSNSGDEWAVVTTKQTIQKLYHKKEAIETAITSRQASAVNLANPYLMKQDIDSLRLLAKYRTPTGLIDDHEAERHKDHVRRLIVESDLNTRTEIPIVRPVLQTVYQFRTRL